MLNLWHDLPCGQHPPEIVTAVIEIPSGSRNKYELDKASGMLKLDRVLFSAVHYPGDYGFIPRTLHEDNDPLDVLVMVKEQTFPGCQIDIRPLVPTTGLDSVSASIETVRGRVASRWRRTGQGLELDVTIPANATARIYVPAANAAAVREIGGGSDVVAERASGVKLLRVEGDRVVYEVGSGQYSFRVARMK